MPHGAAAFNANGIVRRANGPVDGGLGRVACMTTWNGGR